MDIRTFQKFRTMVYESCGIKLNETKMAMVSSRISKRMRLLGITKHQEYLEYLLNDSSGEEKVNFLDVISTNTTFFFREHEHFEFLGKLIHEMINNGQRKIRIWCAASSTGEEPYSIAMTLLMSSPAKSIDMKILATDISTKVLKIAQSGKYELSKMQKVPQHFKKKYFHTVRGEENCYTASDSLKNLILFRRLNLLQTPYPMKGQLDIVFCRNVMIYFDNDLRLKLISEIHRLLKPNGYLITGHAESISSLNVNFRGIKPSIHIKN